MTRRRWWVLLAVLSFGLILLDVVTGPYIMFPITFVIPVGLAAWHLGRRAALGFSAALVGSRLWIVLAVELVERPLWTTALNAAIRLLVLALLAVFVAKAAEQELALERRVKMLEGVLPICAFCKKIRNAAGKWEKVEEYITARSGVRFSSEYCDACGMEHFPKKVDPEAGNRG